MNKIIHFLKYNNATVFILLAIILLGGSAFAATETGQQVIGQQTTSVQGVDNTLLIAADLAAINFDFKIEKIQQDMDYYFVTYTLLNLVKVNNAWQYELQEKTRKVTKNIKQDLGAYLAEEFKQEHDALVRDLKEEQAKANLAGAQTREEVTEYTGLIGKTLDIVANIFPEYEAVKKRELPSPDFSAGGLIASTSPGSIGAPDNLTAIYNNYINQNDPDQDNIFGFVDNCPMIYNPDQLDADGDGVGDACDIDQMDPGTASSTATSTVDTAPSDPAPVEPVPEIVPDIIIPANPASGEPVAEPPGAEAL